MPAACRAVIIAASCEPSSRARQFVSARTGWPVTFRHGNCEIESRLTGHQRTTVSFSDCVADAVDGDKQLRAIHLWKGQREN
jgi:hypothetical protein